MKQSKINMKDSKLGLWCFRNRYYLLAFIIPVLSMLVVYYFKDIAPFGDMMYLRSDCYHQYAPYLQILQDKLQSGGSLFYTWQIGTGMNFLAIAAYYLSSPLNLLTILWPGNIADIVSFFILIKMGLASFSVTYYLSKRFGKLNAITVTFGIAYGLSAYFAAFSWNIMWLDCMWLFPFMILGLDYLVTKRKSKMYCVALALAIFSNYYIGIMLCIYSVIYFIYLFFTADIDTTAGKIKSRLLIIKDYALYSLLGGAMAACVILPEYFNLLTTKSADSEFPATIENYFSVMYMLFRSLICIPVADLKYPHDPNIYCSVAIFFLIPLFWLCRKIKLRDRIGKTLIAAFMLFSFSVNIPNYIWHGMHFPNSLPCRQSFIYIFLVLTMGYEAFLYIKEYKAWKILTSLCVAIGLTLVLQKLNATAQFFSDLGDIDTNMNKIIYVSLIFMMIYGVLIFAYRSKPNWKGFFAYLMILTVFTEMTFNMNVTGIGSTSSRGAYYESTSAYAKLNEDAKKDAKNDNAGFYRTEEVSHTTRNDGARFGYSSISTFSSVSSAAIQDYYNMIGMQTSYNAYSYYGHTPLTAALFSIKYEFSSSTASLPNNETLFKSTQYTPNSGGSSTLNLYKYNKTLPLGFMINSSTMADWDLSTGNPFETQNGFVKTAIDNNLNIFHKLKASTAGTFSADLDLEKSDNYKPTRKETSYDVYFFCTTSSENLTATVTGKTQNNTFSFSSTNQNYICHIGNVAKGSVVKITTGDNQAISTCYAYAFDNDAWNTVYDKLNAHPFKVSEFSDTKISGSITADSDGLMYTSIPFDKGWSIYVDGTKMTATEICNGSLTGVFVPAGTHKIEMKYCPQGFVSGIILTIGSLIILLFITFRKQIVGLFKKKKKE